MSLLLNETLELYFSKEFAQLRSFIVLNIFSTIYVYNLYEAKNTKNGNFCFHKICMHTLHLNLLQQSSFATKWFIRPWEDLVISSIKNSYHVSPHVLVKGKIEERKEKKHKCTKEETLNIPIPNLREIMLNAALCIKVDLNYFLFAKV